MTSLILQTGENGEITIPETARSILGLKKNDSVSIRIVGKDIYIKKVESYLRLVTLDTK